MPKVNLLSLDGKAKQAQIPDEIVSERIDPMLIARAIRYYRNRKRAGTASTKTRSEVRGGGKKPWAQKGTGNARQGSIRAPQWVGGGRVHGPKPHRTAIWMTYRDRRAALRHALAEKLQAGTLQLLKQPSMDKPDTPPFSRLVDASDLPSRVLFVLDADATNAYLSVRNLQGADSKRALSLTAYDVASAGSVILTEKSVDVLKARLTEERGGDDESH